MSEEPPNRRKSEIYYAHFRSEVIRLTAERGQLRAELTAANLALASAVKERDEARRERDEFQADLQKVCDHDWQHIDDSFDHEFGTEQLHSCLCEKCGATKPYEPETFGDEAI